MQKKMLPSETSPAGLNKDVSPQHSPCNYSFPTSCCQQLPK
jgi:hypothetical protein